MIMHYECIMRLTNTRGVTVRMLLSLVAHIVGYKMMVNAHNTVLCHMHVGGFIVFTMYDK
jgi:predicted tellurium resistance membrane protein TerC